MDQRNKYHFSTVPDQLFIFHSVLACAPSLARTFLINVKPVKKSKLVKDDDKDRNTTSAGSSPLAQDSKYRIEQPSAAVVAFAHRLGLDQLKDQTLVMRIVTHGSYERVGIQTNEKLDYLGKQTLIHYHGVFAQWGQIMVTDHRVKLPCGGCN